MSDTCIVVPCFNEEFRIPINRFKQYISENNVSFLFVNDGSTDGTDKVLYDLKNEHPNLVDVYNLAYNKGKAEAVRVGINHLLKIGKFNFVGYFDADLSTDLSEIGRLKSHLFPDDSYCFAMASRVNRLGSNINRYYYRHLMGRIFATVTTLILNIAVYDSQCGAKLLSTDFARKIFDQEFISSWLFDVELILRVKKMNELYKVVEVPINEWNEKGGSKIRATHLFQFLIDFVKIACKYRTINSRL